MQAATNCLGVSVAVTRQFIKVIHPEFTSFLKFLSQKVVKSDIFRSIADSLLAFTLTQMATKAAGNKNAAIGIFDSGVGGLTVARAIIDQLPGESILYIGGTARGPYVSEKEIERVSTFLRLQGSPTYIEEVTRIEEQENDEVVLNSEGKDELYNKAVEIIKTEGKASTSFLQRKLGIGYNRAARIIDQMEEEKIISPANHVGKREIY